MSIYFEAEIAEMISNLNNVKGYLDCEKIVICNIKKHIVNSVTDEIIIQFLKRQTDYFKCMIKDSQGSIDCSNYRFASGFIYILLKKPN